MLKRSSPTVTLVKKPRLELTGLFPPLLFPFHRYGNTDQRFVAKRLHLGHV